MKRTEVTQRDVNSNALRVERGWAAEIDGVPVVICRAGSDRKRWLVYEPTRGREVCGTWGDTRADVLACAASRVEKAARMHGLSAGDFLRRLVAGSEAVVPFRAAESA